MLENGILNPAILSLLARVRHTNYLVIADRGFPSFKGVETVDISLVDDIPQVVDVLKAIVANFKIGRVYVAKEFKANNDEQAWTRFQTEIPSHITVEQLASDDLKVLVPRAVGIIRTGDTTQYANLILESA